MSGTPLSAEEVKRLTKSWVPRVKRKRVGRPKGSKNKYTRTEIANKYPDEVVHMLNKGTNVHELAKHYGVSYPTMFGAVQMIGKWYFIRTRF